EIVAALNEISAEIPVILPVHPRTRARISEFGVTVRDDVRLVEPVGYVDFLALQAHAAVVVTDSGGVQEETTFLGVPCLTVRPNTERPVTITAGTNQLVEQKREAIVSATKNALARSRKETIN